MMRHSELAKTTEVYMQSDDCSGARESRYRLTPTRFGVGVFEIALPHRGNAFRVVYAVQLRLDLWVIYAFQKKATQGIKTPKHEIGLIKDRLKGEEVPRLCRSGSSNLIFTGVHPGNSAHEPTKAHAQGATGWTHRRV